MNPTDDLKKSSVPDAVFRVWNNRWKIEIEAAQIFSRLADDLFTLRGKDDVVGEMAAEAAEDERRHAIRCQQILSMSQTVQKKLEPNLNVHLGPIERSLPDRILYTCVAAGCVTETLSTALLLEMRKRAEPGLIKNTVHEILVDEVNHSRIGWAELARCAKNRDVTWLAEHIPAMIDDALMSDVKPMLATNIEDLSPWGILPRAEAHSIMTETIHTVIGPGLREFGIEI